MYKKNFELRQDRWLKGKMNGAWMWWYLEIEYKNPHKG